MQILYNWSHRFLNTTQSGTTTLLTFFFFCLCSHVALAQPGTSIQVAASCLNATSFDYAGSDGTRNIYQYNVPGDELEFAWDNVQMRWEIRIQAPGNTGFEYAYSSFASIPNPPDLATGGWTFTVCPITGISGDGTQNALTQTCTDAEAPEITCPFISGTEVVTLQFADFNGGSYNWEIFDGASNSAAFGVSNTFGTSQVMPTLDCGQSYLLLITHSSAPLTNLQLITSDGTVINESGVASGSAYPFSISPCVGSAVITASPSPGTCTAVVNDLAPTATDDCTVSPSVSYVLSGATTGSGNGDASGTTFNGGTTTITYTATDDENNMTSCMVDVEVIDDVPPTISCPGTITNAILSANCTKTLSDYTVFVNASDGCDTNLDLTQSPESGEIITGPQTLTVTVTATDDAGNSNSCTYMVPFVDSTAPTANCPSDVTVSNAAGQCGANATFIIPDPSDNCSGATSVASPASGTSFNVGTTPVTVTATDGSGNQNTCMFNVTVNDTEDPTANCPATQTASNTNGQCGANVSFTIPNPSDNCSATSSANPASGSFFDVGTTQVTVTATDGAGNTGTCTFDVVVNDTENPMITCPADVTVSAPANQCFTVVTFGDPTTSDNCPGETFMYDIASGSNFNVGTTQVTGTVTDASSNTAQCTFDVTVNDVTDPSATCPNDVTVSAAQGQCGATVTFAGPLVSDACGIAPAGGVACTPAPGSFFEVGSTPVTCTVTDVNGNSSTCSFNVIVEDNEDPTANCPGTQTVNNTAGQCGATVNFPIPDLTDNCPGIGQFASHNPGDFFPVGTTMVTVTAVDASSNSASCTFDVTVNDTEAPNMACNSFTLPLTGPSATITEAQVDNNSTDNCPGPAPGGITNLSLDNNTFTCSTLGPQTVTLTGTDAAGNSSSCQATITVVDNNPPTAVCANPTVNLTSDATTSVAASFFDGGSSAVCGDLTFSASQLDFDCDDVGNTIPVTLTVTADNTQTATCTAMVTVTDDDSFCCAPADAVCNNTTVQLNASGMASIMPSDVGGGSTADCGLMSESVTPMDFTCADLAAPVSVTYTITDINGASDNCTAMVTVEDNIPPTPVCKTTTVELSPDNGMYTLLESDVYDANASSDNCSIDNVSFTAATYDCDDEDQTFTVEVTVTDAGGNNVSCDAMITVVVGNALPGGWSANDVGNSGFLGNEYSFDPCTPTNGEFSITGGGNNATSSTTDNVAFASQTLCGNNVTITAKIESVDPNGYGGLMIRETNAAGSKQVAVFSNLSPVLRHETRYTTNGPKQVNAFFKPLPTWLRLQRMGDWIFAYYSNNGVNFSYVHGVYVPMSSCVQVGLASFTYIPGQQTTTVFSNVSVSGGNAPVAEVPTITEAGTSKQLPSLYPNPTRDIANLVFEDGLSNDATIILRNQLGQVVEQRQLRAGDYRTEWDVSTLADGLYLFEIRQEGEGVQVLRLVKTK